jgi:hypothetical protein
MGELFSNQIPTEPGWYWLSNGVDRIVAQLFPSRRAGILLVSQIDIGEAVSLTTLADLGWKFGPLVPSPEEIVQTLVQPLRRVATDAERQVKLVHPNAVCIRNSYLLKIVSHPGGKPISKGTFTEEQAWADAAQKLEGNCKDAQ